MAAWEWRVFLAIPSKVDIWELLRTKPWGLFRQERTDIYLVCSASAGVKLRGKKTLEVKLRSCRHESGAELWEKEVSYKPQPRYYVIAVDKIDLAAVIDFSPLRKTKSGMRPGNETRSARWDGKDRQMLGSEVAEKLSKQKEWIVRSASAEKLQSMEDAIAIASKPVKLVPLKKRTCKHGYHSVTVEQTDFTIPDSQPEKKWRTICFEGNLDDIGKLLQMKPQVPEGKAGSVGSGKILQDHLMQLAGTPCGYPEFVSNVLQEDSQ